MSAIYDNWERLVAAVLKKQQLWQLFHDLSRSPSILSSFGSTSTYSLLDDLPSPLARLGSPSTSRRIPKLVLVSDFSPAIDAECGVRLASSEFLGRGTFGSAYAAVMSNGAKIVVKRLEKSTGISETEFSRHMAIVGNIWQENVVALRAYCSTEDERLMLYDYYRGGSVYALLHGETGQTQDYVSWETRLKIAIGAARGIAKIHSQNGETLVHGNIKASNIFLNSQEYGCVSDLGVTTTADTKFAPAAQCYAPEVEKTKDVSQASDVYSFGILLLELLTRKPTVHVPGGPQAVNLVKLITSTRHKSRAANVFDAYLLKDATVKDQVVKMLEIGVRCVVKSRKKRPNMREVVKALEDISGLNAVISHDGVTKRLVFVEDGNATFSIDDVLRASAEFLGKGMIGTCYKATLENGNTVVVKRLDDVVVSFDDFRHLLEAIGSLRHDNVANLRAYFYSKDEKLLVYDKYYLGSVSTLLHGKRGNVRTPLDLETRLKIVLGVARGVACIHKKNVGKLVHGNIKSSNIFLDTQYHSIVSDVGLVKLVGPNNGVRNSGYCAPEVMDEDTRRVSQASDVYSFGVVMLEILFRKQSKFIMDGGKVMLLVNWVQFIVRDEWTADVFDAELLGDNREVEAMLQVLQIAMDCIRLVPELRPRMSQVVTMLEEISGAEPQNEPSVESRLEDVLEDLLPKMY